MGNTQLAASLRMLRQNSRKTQKEVSKYLNISRQAYSNYENNKRTPDINMLLKLTHLYQVSLDQLINTKEIIAFEKPGLYFPGIEIASGDPIYLNEEEKNLILVYRNMSPETKSLLNGFIKVQEQGRQAAKDK